MALSFVRRTATLCVGVFFLLDVCSAATNVTRTQDVSATAKTPYKKILVISLFKSFDTRRYLEKEIVKELNRLGTAAVASTTMMDSRTPVVRETFVAMVEKIGADAALLTQLGSLETKGKMIDMNPQATLIFRPTVYYNVFEVQQTEFVEPQGVELKSTLVLGTQLLSVATELPVWAIEAKSKLVQKTDQIGDYKIFIKEAKVIVSHLSKDKLIAH